MKPCTRCGHDHGSFTPELAACLFEQRKDTPLESCGDASASLPTDAEALQLSSMIQLVRKIGTVGEWKREGTTATVYVDRPNIGSNYKFTIAEFDYAPDAEAVVLIIRALRALESAKEDQDDPVERSEGTSEPITTPDRPSSPSRADLEGLRLYVEWFGAAHVGECPADDTCKCAGKPWNDAVNCILADTPTGGSHDCVDTGVAVQPKDVAAGADTGRVADSEVDRARADRAGGVTSPDRAPERKPPCPVTQQACYDDRCWDGCAYTLVHPRAPEPVIERIGQSAVEAMQEAEQRFIASIPVSSAPVTAWSDAALSAALLSFLYRLYDAGGISCGRSWESRLVEPALRLMDPWRPPGDIATWPSREDVVREAEDRIRRRVRTHPEIASAPVTAEMSEALRAQCLKFHNRSPMAVCREAVDETGRQHCIICRSADALDALSLAHQLRRDDLRGTDTPEVGREAAPVTSPARAPIARTHDPRTGDCTRCGQHEPDHAPNCIHFAYATRAPEPVTGETLRELTRGVCDDYTPNQPPFGIGEEPDCCMRCGMLGLRHFLKRAADTLDSITRSQREAERIVMSLRLQCDAHQRDQATLLEEIASLRSQWDHEHAKVQRAIAYAERETRASLIAEVLQIVDEDIAGYRGAAFGREALTLVRAKFAALSPSSSRDDGQGVEWRF